MFALYGCCPPRESKHDGILGTPWKILGILFEETHAIQGGRRATPANQKGPDLRGRIGVRIRTEELPQIIELLV